MNSLRNREITTWCIDIATNRLSLSDGFISLMGMTTKEASHGPNILRDMVYPEDILTFDEHMDSLYAGQISSLEYRIVTHTNELKWIQSVGIPAVNQEDNLDRIDTVVLDISEKRMEHEQVERTFNLYQEMLAKIDVAVWSFDLAKIKVYISDAITNITGYSIEKASGYRFLSDIAHEDDLPLIYQITENVRKGIPNVSEYRIIHANGEERWLQVSIIPSMDKDQNVVRHDGAVIDITARKELEDTLHKNEQRYKSLFQHNSDVIVELDNLGNVLDMNPAGYLIKRDNDSIKDVNLFDINIFGSEHAMVMKQHLEKALRGESPQYKIATRYGGSNLIHWDVKNVPVYVNNQVMGAFVIGKNVTFNTEVERKLAEREAEYRLIADNMKDMVGIVDREGNLIVASPSCERTLGIPVGLNSSVQIFQYIHPDDQQDIDHLVNDMIHKKEGKLIRCRFIHTNKTIIHLESICSVVLGDTGEVENILILSRDITKRVKVENELKASEERYHRLIELSPQPMMLHQDSIMLDMNTAGMNLFGATDRNELIDKSIQDFMYSYNVIDNNVRPYVDNKNNNPIRYRIQRIDGKQIIAEVVDILDDVTRTTLLLMEDVTQRLQMERALQESEERYRRLVELSPIAIAVYKDQKISYINPAGTEILEVDSLVDIISTPPMSWVHPDSQVDLKKALGNTVLNGYSPPAEYQLIAKDNRVIDVSLLTIYDSRSSSIQLMVEDITEKKQIQQALIESKGLNGRLVELSPEAIVLHSDYKFIFVNPAALRLFGVSSQSELIGRSILDVVHPDYLIPAEARIGTIYEQHTTTALVEQKIIRRSGEVIDVEVIASTVPYQGGNAGLSLFRDIRARKKGEEDRKLADELIRQSEERYFHLQTSLDQFSHNLFGAMKISQIEHQLLHEVQEIVQVSNVSLISVEHNTDELCKITETDRGYTVKLNEDKGKSYLLYIDEKPISLKTVSNRVWLETISRYVSVLFDNFLIIEDLTKELEQAISDKVTPTWLLRFLFNLSENERKNLAQDLHDSALQEQIIWYRKLDLLLSDSSLTGALREQLGQITEGLLDVIYQLRITCNELRPPMLIKDGLIATLESLFEFTQLRSNYRITFHAEQFNHILTDEVLVGLYRIIQELLANASKHSSASEVHILLASQDERIRLEYRDDGIGMNVIEPETLRKGSMGIYGMRERVRSMEGTIQFFSSESKGLTIVIEILTS
ncbi:sensor histidine kinase [Paenibacillus sp. CMAA1364]